VRRFLPHFLGRSLAVLPTVGDQYYIWASPAPRSVSADGDPQDYVLVGSHAEAVARLPGTNRRDDAAPGGPRPAHHTHNGPPMKGGGMRGPKEGGDSPCSPSAPARPAPGCPRLRLRFF